MRTMAEPPPSDTIVVLSTCPDEITARQIARDLVESGLAGCVTRLAGFSTYRWEGQTCDEAQVLLLVKSVMSRYLELQKRLKALLPDAVPEILALPVQAGDPGYLSWLNRVLS